MAAISTHFQVRHRPTVGLLAAAAVAVAGLTWWGWRGQPPTRLVGSQRVAGGTIVPLERSGERPRAWSAELRLASTPPGLRWSLFEGAAPGEGYELHWRPDLPGLALWRSQRPLLLGTLPLERMPERVLLVRRGARLEVRVDGEAALVCIDPIGAPDPAEPPRTWAWGCRADPAIPDAVFTVQLRDGRRDWGADVPVRTGPNPELDAALADQERPDRPLLLLRHALALIDAGRDPVQAGFALGQARIAIDPLSVLTALPAPARDASDADSRHLRLWLGLGRVRLALGTRAAGGGTDPQRADTEVVAAELGELTALTTDGETPPELPGIVLSLLPALAEHATWTPDYPREPTAVLATRAAWFRLLGDATAIALRSPLPEELRLQVRLTAHGAGCALAQLAPPAAAPPSGEGFAGLPQPTPVDAPVWLLGRWRALAGSDPGQAPLPTLPGPADGPLQRCLERLAGAAGIAPVAAVHLRTAILAEIDRLRRERGGGREAEALLAIDDALDAGPAREAALARAMVALWLPGRNRNRAVRLQEARKDLLTAIDGISLELTDPVAFALLTLIEAVQPDLVADADRERRQERATWTTMDGDGWLRRLPLPRRLAAYAPLLDGRPRATDQIWVGDLHPTQALVAALAMQQVARLAAGRVGERPAVAAPEARLPAVPAPDWALLRRMPCLTLPAELLIPAEAPADRGPAGGAPPGRTVPP